MHCGKLRFFLGRVYIDELCSAFHFVCAVGDNTALPGALDLDPGSQIKSMNSWCVSFETECKSI